MIQMRIDVTKISSATVTRFIVLVLALVNQVLSASGHPVLPIDDAQVEMLVTSLFTVGSALVGYWFDNDVTRYAIERKKAGEEIMSAQEDTVDTY